MDRLSSCYFCGTAMDDTLREYRVVPVELRGGDDVTTATLCPTCHDKLERLLAPVVGAAGGDGATLDAREPHRRPADSPDDAQPGTTDSDEEAAGPAGDDGDDSDRNEGHSGSETEDGEREDDERPGGTEPDLVDVDGPLAGGSGSEGDGETVRITHTREDDGTDGGTDPGEREDGGETADSTDDNGRADDGREENDGGKVDDGGEEDDGEEPEPAQTTVSALEYNKVMRLLQNREFPVDRAEIQAVAANAYGLAEHECAEVIDLAVDRGLIAERDGQLVRPE